MDGAAKVIDWNGTDVPLELAVLPPGRYRIEAIDVEHSDQGSGGFELTPELEAGIEAGIRSARAGRVVPWETVNAELKTIISGARDRSG